MKKWLSIGSFVLISPAVAAGLLAAGSATKEHLGGRLLQVAGACLAIVWLTGTFLIVGSLLSGGAGYRGIDPGTMARNVETPSSRSKKDGEEEEAAK